MHVWRTGYRRGGTQAGAGGRGARARRALVRLAPWLTALALAAAAAAQGAQGETATGGLAGSPFLAAALATGLAAIGAGIAVGIAGAAAIGAISEKPELLGRTLIFVGLAEGIVIYGLIVSFIILGAG
jgi:V/A-type H+-transporting ATPase subunit K